RLVVAAGLLEQLASRRLEFVERDLAVLVGVGELEDRPGELIAHAEAADLETDAPHAGKLLAFRFAFELSDDGLGAFPGEVAQILLLAAWTKDHSAGAGRLWLLR